MTYHAKRTEGRPGAPLLLTFHGTGGSEDQFHGFAESLIPGAHVVSPRGDVSEHGALRYFRRTGEGVYDMDDLARRTEAMADFVAGEVARTGAGQVMAFGYSNGANILASVLMARPGLIHALAADEDPLTDDDQRRAPVVEHFGLVTGAFGRSLEQAALHRVIIDNHNTVGHELGFLTTGSTGRAFAIARDCQQSLKIAFREMFAF